MRLEIYEILHLFANNFKRTSLGQDGETQNVMNAFANVNDKNDVEMYAIICVGVQALFNDQRQPREKSKNFQPRQIRHTTAKMADE